MNDDRQIDVDNLEYRELSGEEELAGLARLYDIAGWGPVDPAVLGLWFLTPREAGTSLIMVISEPGEHELLGMTIYQPYRAWLGDHVGIAVRTRAAVLDPRLRRSGRGVTMVDKSDPLVLLGEAAQERMALRDWHISVGLPNPKMVLRGELVTFEWEGFGSLATYGDGRYVDLTRNEPTGGTLDISIGNVDGREVGDDYDKLWAKALKNMPFEFALMRDAQALRSRFLRGLLLEARRPGSDELVGFTYFGRLGSRKLDDALAIDPDAMTDVILSATSWLRNNRDSYDSDGFEAIPHPLHQPALDSLEPQLIDWMYSFFVSSTYDGPVADATKWYATAGD